MSAEFAALTYQPSQVRRRSNGRGGAEISPPYMQKPQTVKGRPAMFSFRRKETSMAALSVVHLRLMEPDGHECLPSFEKSGLTR